jgi:hypothetical protein
VLARLGTPAIDRLLYPSNGEGDDSKALQYLAYPDLGLSFVIGAKQRGARDPAIESMTLRAPWDPEQPRRRAASPPGGEDSTTRPEDASPWTTPQGLHVGMDQEAFGASAAQHFRVVRDNRLQAQARGEVTLGASSRASDRGVEVALNGNGVRSIVFRTEDLPRTDLGRRQLPSVAMAAGLGGLLGYLLLLWLRRRERALGSAAPQRFRLPAWLLPWTGGAGLTQKLQPDGWGNALRQVMGFAFVAAGGMAALVAWRLAQMEGGYADKLNTLYLIGALISAQVGLTLLASVRHMWVMLTASMLLVVSMVVLGLAELIST